MTKPIIPLLIAVGIVAFILTSFYIVMDMSYKQGYMAHKAETELANAKARKDAQAEQRKLDSGDRSGVVQFDRE